MTAASGNKFIRSYHHMMNGPFKTQFIRRRIIQSSVVHSTLGIDRYFGDHGNSLSPYCNISVSEKKGNYSRQTYDFPRFLG